MESRERREAGDILGRLGDPRFDAEVFHLPRCYRGSPEPLLGFIEVRSDSFTMGSEAEDKMAFDDERPSHPLDLPAFHIARYTVTNNQYRCFVEAALGAVFLGPSALERRHTPGRGRR